MHEAGVPDDAVTIGVLGPVLAGGSPVPGVRARRLLVALVLADGRPVSADRLVDEVWGDDEPPKSPHAALHTQISRVRAVIRPAVIEAVAGGYRLDAHTDLARAEAALDAPGTGEQALRLWRGVPGDDLGAGGPADELARRAAVACDRLEARTAAAALDAGDFPAARAIAERRIAADPLDEPARILLMRALHGEGRTAEALAAYADLRRTSVTELGTEPGDVATRLHRELLAGTAPPASPAPARAPAVGLPAETTPLIGRDDEVAALVELVGAARVVTVVGPGGVGKTRIAEAVGTALARAGTAVYYVPLASVRSADDVLPAVARVLGVAEPELGADGRPRRAIRDLDALVLSALGGRRCVLILDNCEQVVDACAAMVADLIAGAPAVTVLATSRSPLQIRAERVHPLPVLGTVGADSAAVELFAQRARAVRPDALLPADAVAELCRRLDGLPLAIELAAARVRTLTVEEIAGLLQQRFSLLRSADRTTPDRHRTLHAVIEWSWDLLDPDAQTALRRLCRFPAGFGAGAAAGVTGMDRIALDDALTSLANQSLLHVTEREGRSRYRMLETVREFGEEKVAASDPGEDAAIESGMADWASELATRMWREYRGTGGHAVLERIADDAENLVFVLRRTVDRMTGGDLTAVPTVIRVFPLIAGLWSMRGLHGQVQEWGAQILGALPRPPRDLGDEERELWQVTALACCANPAIGPTSRLVARGRTQIRRLHRPGDTLRRPGDFLSAIFLQHTVTGVLRLVVRGVEASDREVRMLALAARMNLRENRGDLAGALADSNAMSGVVQAGDVWLEAMMAMSSASIYGQQARWAEAAERFALAADSMAAVGAEDEAKQATGYLIASLCCLGRLDEARGRLAVLAEGWTPEDPDPEGNPEAVASMMVAAAEVARLEGDPRPDLYRRAGELVVRRIPEGSRDPGGEMLVSVALLGMVECGAAAQGERLVEALIASDEAMFGPVGYWDLPQAATMALAVGEYLAARDPDSPQAELLRRLALRLGARQDYPVLHTALARLREQRADTGPRRAAADRVDTVTRSEAVRLLRATTAELRQRALRM